MKAPKKLIAAAAVVLALILTAVIASRLISYYNAQSNKAEAVAYLVEKYGFDEEKIKVKSYVPRKVHNDDTVLPVDMYVTNQSWFCEYNGREFGVIKYNDTGFADNYQLEELSELVTEYLQKNIDENICGFEIYGKMFSEKVENMDIKAFISSQPIIKNYVVYYLVDSLDDYYNAKKRKDSSVAYFANDKLRELSKSIQESFDNTFEKNDVSLVLVTEVPEFEREAEYSRDGYYIFSYGLSYERMEELEKKNILR